MVFELWELESANLIVEYDSEDAALEFVRSAIRAHGREYVLSWELARAPVHGDTEAIASGEKLVERAFKGIAA